MPVAVDFNPFETQSAGIPVDHNPFASGPPLLTGTARDIALGVGKIDTALLRGIANIIGSPGDAVDALSALGGYLQRVGGHEPMPEPTTMRLNGKDVPLKESPSLPRAADVKNFIFNTLGTPEFQAESKGGRIAQGFAEGVGSAIPMMMGNPAPLLTAAYSGLSGAGAAAGKELDIDPVEHPVLAKLAPIIAAVGAPTVFAGVRALFPSVPSIVKSAVKGNAPLLDEASQTQRMGEGMGVTVTGPEAMNDPTLLRIQSMAEQHPNGTPLRAVMDARPDAQRAAVTRQTETLGNMTPSQSAATTAQAAKNTIGAAQTARTAAVKPFYETAALQAVPKSSLDDVFTEIDSQLSKVGEGSEIGKELLRYRDTIKTAIDGDLARVGPLDTIYKEVRDRARLTPANPTAINKETYGILGPINTKMGNALTRENFDLAAGRATYQEMTPPVTELKTGQIGALAPKKLGDVAPPTIESQSKVMLDPNNVRPDEVTKTLRALNKTDPEATPNFIKSYVENTLDQASKRTMAGPQQNIGGKFYTTVAGTPNAKANLRAAYGTLPDGTDRWQAFENTLRVFEANARRLPVGSPTVEKSMLEGALSGGSLAQPLSTFSNWWTRMRYGRNVGQLAELFARSDSVDEMRRLAGMAADDPQARIMVGTFINANQGAPSGGQK